MQTFLGAYVLWRPMISRDGWHSPLAAKARAFFDAAARLLPLPPSGPVADIKHNKLTEHELNKADAGVEPEGPDRVWGWDE